MSIFTAFNRQPRQANSKNVRIGPGCYKEGHRDPTSASTTSLTDGLLAVKDPPRPHAVFRSLHRAKDPYAQDQCEPPIPHCTDTLHKATMATASKASARSYSNAYLFPKQHPYQHLHASNRTSGKPSPMARASTSPERGHKEVTKFTITAGVSHANAAEEHHRERIVSNMN